MNIRQLFKRYVPCALALFLGIGSIILLLSLITPAQATPMASHDLPQEITGTVTIWHSYWPEGGEGIAFNQIISNVLEENPGLVITATYVDFNQIFSLYETAVISGGGPDMFVAPNDWLGYFAREGVISNLDDYLQGRLTGVYTSAIEGMKVNGHLYGVPESAKAVALFYNTTAISSPITTTVDLMNLVQDGKKLVIADGWGGGAYYNFGFFGAFGGHLLNPDGRCIAKDGGVADAMQYLVDLKLAGATIITDTWQQGFIPFCMGDIDMLVDGPWNLVNYQSCLGDDLGLSLLPTGPVDVARPMNGIDGFYINPNTDNITTTVEAALLLTNQESSQIYTDLGGHVPIREDVIPSNPFIATFSEASEQGWPRYQGPEMDNYWWPFGDMMTWVLDGVYSPEDGVTIACDNMNWLNGFDQRFFLPVINGKP